MRILSLKPVLDVLCAGRNGLPARRHNFDFSFPNFGSRLHPGYGGEVAHTVGYHHRAGYIHVHHVAILPGIPQIHVDQQEEGHRS